MLYKDIAFERNVFARKEIEFLLVQPNNLLTNGLLNGSKELELKLTFLTNVADNVAN